MDLALLLFSSGGRCFFSLSPSHNRSSPGCWGWQDSWPLPSGLGPLACEGAARGGETGGQLTAAPSLLCRTGPSATPILPWGGTPCLYLSNHLVIWQPQYSEGLKKSSYFTVYLAFLVVKHQLEKMHMTLVSQVLCGAKCGLSSSGESTSDGSESPSQ